MTRPSMLQRAEVCGLAPVLAEKYPETGDAANRGTAIHAQIAAALRGESQPVEYEAQAAVAWARDAFQDCAMKVECKVSLIDTDTMETITEGTPDLVANDGSMDTIVDWKTGRQENVDDVDTNLQLIAYGLSVCDGGPFRCALVFLAGEKVDYFFSGTFEPDQHPALLARVKAAATREPVAHPGEWCGACYQRRYCDAWKARESQAIALIDADRALAVTNENAGLIMARAKAVKEAAEAAEAIIKAHVRNGGRCVVDGKELALSMCKGRETADVKALKEDGLTKYLRQGADYERATWKKAAK
jgi:hypothetical protein